MYRPPTGTLNVQTTKSVSGAERIITDMIEPSLWLSSEHNPDVYEDRALALSLQR